MARFSVYQNPGNEGYLIDVQADLMAHLNTRLVVPLAGSEWLLLSFRGRFEPVPRFDIEPRVGGFYWGTKMTVAADDNSVSVTHKGGGVTANP